MAHSCGTSSTGSAWGEPAEVSKDWGVKVRCCLCRSGVFFMSVLEFPIHRRLVLAVCTSTSGPHPAPKRVNSPSKEKKPLVLSSMVTAMSKVSSSSLLISLLIFSSTGRGLQSYLE